MVTDEAKRPAYIKVGWVSLYANSELGGRNDNSELLGCHAGGQGDVEVDVLDSLIPLGGWREVVHSCVLHNLQCHHTS